MRILITVKLKRNPEHDPRNKITGMCPLASKLGYDILCSDMTGSHHTYLVEGAKSIIAVRKRAKELFGHVTRIEVFPNKV